MSVAMPWESRSGGSYEELEELGSGAYGTVYAARHSITGRVVAKKKVVVPVSEDGVPQALIREIGTLKALQRLHHPNVAQVASCSAPH